SGRPCWRDHALSCRLHCRPPYRSQTGAQSAAVRRHMPWLLETPIEADHEGGCWQCPAGSPTRQKLLTYLTYSLQRRKASSLCHNGNGLNPSSSAEGAVTLAAVADANCAPQSPSVDQDRNDGLGHADQGQH